MLAICLFVLIVLPLVPLAGMLGGAMCLHLWRAARTA